VRVDCSTARRECLGRGILDGWLVGCLRLLVVVGVFEVWTLWCYGVYVDGGEDL